jgi:hypothetical protein
MLQKCNKIILTVQGLEVQRFRVCGFALLSLREKVLRHYAWQTGILFGAYPESPSYHKKPPVGAASARLSSSQASREIK